MVYSQVSFWFPTGRIRRRGLLILCLLLALSFGLSRGFWVSRRSYKPAPENRLVLRRLCARNLLMIYQALQEYRLEYGDYPQSLRKLTPRFFSPQKLLCPADLGATGGRLANGSYFYPAGPGKQALILPYNRRIREVLCRRPGAQQEQVLVYCPWHWEARPGYSIDYLLVVTASGKVWEIGPY